MTTYWMPCYLLHVELRSLIQGYILEEVHNNVANPLINLPFGDALYHPFIATLGMVFHWVYHKIITMISILTAINPYQV